ncbi:TPA: hypothetical protein ACY3XX_003106 [Yersinia enterocolitica]|uniref:Uncharacterized protein n=3 Tax=Yersinia enterocolitica TaxID=630 RepID=A0A0E1NJU6_YEREN|nr:hypothetical protein [Yersinia enterocolitica]CBX71218.1 unknown protein [Yersinia enterocolitica W22703]AJJ27727.1 hypothetical protein CH48_3860 [Yersinia enterocolitica]ALG78833.1 hypothetical protein XM56_10595 [Yersinia enterocolitica]AOF19198.1 hypothetical protein BED34_11935 [Yersinia enterocolitica]AOF23734.1 hypothetical protein BED33_14630 [Yersinia enterocolitica]
MPRHSHDILHDELQGFDEFRYTDISFTFSGDATRQITFRLIFCNREPGDAMLDNLFGEKLATLTISVVSFYNIDAEDNEECDTMFDKPPGAPNLTASEALYLYSILVDIILRIAETESINILTFQAYSEELRRVYDRLVRKYAATKNLETHIEGACYVIRTDN